MRGGYKIIDLKGYPVKVSTETKTVKPGIYEAIEGSLKPILIENLVLSASGNESEMYSTFAFPLVTSTNFAFYFIAGENLVTIVVTDDDEIYYTSEAL